MSARRTGSRQQIEEAGHRFAAQLQFDSAAPEWWGELRRDAMDRFVALGLPTTALEAWKHTSLLPLAKVSFRPAPGDEPHLDAVELESIRRQIDLHSGDAALVFVDGRFVPVLSTPAPPYVRAGSLHAALAAGEPERLGSPADRAFSALNLALFTDGALVDVPNDCAPTSLHLIFFSRGSDPPIASHPRSTVRVGAGSRVTLIERYLGDGIHFTNAVTELQLAENAAARYLQVVDESAGGFHIGLLGVQQARDSRFDSLAVILGGRISRSEVEVTLDGEGAECVLDGLYVARASEHVDCQTTIDHARPHGTSRELYKGVLCEAGEGVFNGRLVIREGAQKTSASQTNKNLLLSERARVETRPQLEIHANDVRCSHGATVGQLDRDALFYLRSRGLPERAARRLLTEAFLHELLERIVPAARPQVAAAVAARLDAEAAA
jgi:Fe-S cluster assembly protein SufD